MKGLRFLLAHHHGFWESWQLGSEPNSIAPFQNQLLFMVADDIFLYLVFDDVHFVDFYSFKIFDGSL